jgi:hypothetical protein
LLQGVIDFHDHRRGLYHPPYADIVIDDKSGLVPCTNFVRKRGVAAPRRRAA